MTDHRHLKLVAPQTPEQHADQKTWVELAERVSRLREERRDEGAAQSRLYSSRARERHGNVVPLGRRIPDPPRPAA